MRLLLLTFLFIISGTTWAQTDDGGKENKNKSKLEVGVDFDQQDPFVNDYYQKGNYLVYDCVGQYWVCTGETEYKICKRNRKNSIKDYDKNIRCAHFSEFDSRQECYKNQQRMTHSADISRFCLHPLEKKRTKNF